MSIVRWSVKKLLAARLRQVEAALRNPAAAQERLLLRLVRRARQTEWGRAHQYGRIRSVRDFQLAVPVQRYHDLAPLWNRSFDGARDVAWPGHVRYFALSSGTTSGATKALPVSREALRANVRAGTTLLALCERLAPGSCVGTGRILYFGGSIQLERRGACWQGDSSGINAKVLPRVAWRYRLPAPDVAMLTDWEAKVDAICQKYLDRPVRTVVGLPSWSLILFRRLVDAARRQRGPSVRSVADVWPDLRAFVHFGMAFEPYRQQFAEIIGRPVANIDTYSSSEGGLNAIQSDPDDPSMQLELDSCAFYEFVPARELDRPDPPRLTLDQVEMGVDYALLLSTPAGIWAYDVGDLVRFTSLRPPKILVVGRTQLTLNLFGEHVIQENLEEALVEACRELRATVRDFTVTSVPPTVADPRGRHRWLIEFDGTPPPLAHFAAKLDAALCARSLDYKTHRDHDASMLPPDLVALAPGTFYEWARSRGTLGGQHKVPRVARSGEMVNELLDVSDKLCSTSRHS